MTQRPMMIVVILTIVTVIGLGGIAVCAQAPQDDVATVALWHLDEVAVNGLTTADDDSQNPGRSRELLLTYPGTNETPPTLTAGVYGQALQFNGNNIARCLGFWQSSWTEFKLEHRLYVSSLPSDLGSAITYLFTSSLFETAIWPKQAADGAIQDYLRLKVYLTSGNMVADIPVADLKNQWLTVVCSYDAAKNLVFSITDAAGNVRQKTATGSYALKSTSADFNFGYTPGKPADRGLRGKVDEIKFSNRVVTPHYAFHPTPAENAVITETPAGLTWSKGLVADGSELYLGTSQTAVTTAQKRPGDLDGSRTVDMGDIGWLSGQWQDAPRYPCADLNFDGRVNEADLTILLGDWQQLPGNYYLGGTAQTNLPSPALLPATTYYWRVASANCAEVDNGQVWKFSTVPLQSGSPSPASGATAVAVTSNVLPLTWIPGFAAHNFAVYFGTTSNPPFYANCNTPSLTSPILQPNTKYYWRVDSIRPDGTATGAVWNYTTGAMSVSNSTPATNATAVTYPLEGVQLSWTSSFTPQTYQVYFGTQNPPSFLAATTQARMLTPAVAANTVYYWRVDCVGSSGTVTGTVWKFTTATPAFPSAEGFGRFARGGRGGAVYHVTNLNDSGAGSFRDAVSQSDRTIVFDVGGQIVLSSRLGITKNRLTIAGQTAPGDGISIAGPGISMGADDLIIRYIRVRYTGTSQDDAFSMNDACDNVIADHVSASWGTDEVFSITGSRKITMQWCMVTEGQNSLGHSKGSLLEWPELTLHHCLYAHNNDRNPKSKGVFDYRNNVVYNWGFAPYIAGDSAGFSYANCVGNYYIAGANTTTDPGVMVVRSNLNYSLYFNNNRIDSNRNGLLDGYDPGMAGIEPGRSLTVMAEPFAYPPVATDTPEVAYERVLAGAGCSRVRDSIDQRVIAGVRNQTGSVITNYTDVGGLGTITGGTTPLDTDQDGMPDDWETSHGLNKSSATDRNDDADGDGYTNLEEYLNNLAGNN